MGYFSNGSEGLDYQERYCFQCRNYKMDDDHDVEGCPVWDAHFLYNGETIFESILNLFIPKTTDRLENEQCLMFLPRQTRRKNKTGKLFPKEASK